MVHGHGPACMWEHVLGHVDVAGCRLSSRRCVRTAVFVLGGGGDVASVRSCVLCCSCLDRAQGSAVWCCTYRVESRLALLGIRVCGVRTVNVVRSRGSDDYGEVAPHSTRTKLESFIPFGAWSHVFSYCRFSHVRTIFAPYSQAEISSEVV